MEQHLSLRRLWLLIRCDVLAEWRMYAFLCAIVAGITILISVHENNAGYPDPSLHQSLFGPFLFIWGIWASSRAFRSLHDRTCRDAYLLLPASALEKLLARLLPLTVGLTILLLAYFCVLSIVVEAFNSAFFGSRRPIFNPFDPDIWELIGFYIILQSPYFLGATWFRRFAFLKTTLALVLLHVGFALFALAVFRLSTPSFSRRVLDGQDIHPELYPDSFDILDVLLFELAGVAVRSVHHAGIDTWAAILSAAMILLPPILWCIAWLRLREARASDGI